MPAHDPSSFEIAAEVRYGDALAAALSQCWRRAPVALAVYLTGLVASIAAGWLSGGTLAWLAVVGAVPGVAVIAFVAATARLDFKRGGGRPLRMLYHVCGSGIEIRAARRSDWIAWDDLWGASETRRSFLLSPSPGEQYVIPKRCCDAGRAEALRELLGRALAGRTGRRSGDLQA
ncbi:MAG: YcxB family protein [Bryobacterales bacterium]|nr:YcxB family protein [Bryobacterales bacterium]